mgnify:CR=1 FL=1
MSLRRIMEQGDGRRFPRPRGDEPAYGLTNDYEVSFSPPARG